MNSNNGNRDIPRWSGGDDDEIADAMNTEILDSIAKHYAATGQNVSVEDVTGTSAAASLTPSPEEVYQENSATMADGCSELDTENQRLPDLAKTHVVPEPPMQQDERVDKDPVLAKVSNQQTAPNTEKGESGIKSGEGDIEQGCNNGSSGRQESQPGAFAEAPEGETDANNGSSSNDVIVGGGSGQPSTRDEGVIAVATAVPEVDEANLQHAQSVQATPTQPRDAAGTDKAFVLSVAGLVVVFVIIVTVAILLGLALTKDSQSEHVHTASKPTVTAAPNATIAPTSMLEGQVLELLPAASLQAIRQPESAQLQAMQWLLDDPNLETYVNVKWRVQQRFALATFFFATAGRGWTSNDDWTSYEHHECSWFSRKFFFPPSKGMKFIEVEHANPCEQANITTEATVSTDDDDQDTRYRHLWLLDNNLVGSIPEEIWLLSDLRSISLSKNSLRGTISPSLGNISSSMEAVTMSLNKLTGTLPTEVGSLNLSLLSVAFNQLHGKIPTELGLMKNWHTAMLDRNHFTGTIPSELFGATSLRMLYLFGNNFTEGTIPSEIGRLERMEDLALDECNLIGTIPSEIGQLAIAYRMNLNVNALTGTLCTELGQLSTVRALEFQDNQLSGPIPSEIALLGNLKEFFLMNNQLSGTIPVELHALLPRANATASSIKAFNATGNPITDPLYTEEDLCWINSTYFEVDCGSGPRHLRSIVCGFCECKC
ncbi:Leucine Rich Repeat [Seminavis robusta]|uniref:Leucine Rich Repeat n=1 Tax=Seminavis robusta TaxID=568900 RepID=A0A9N8EF89_9STRA|nr:Leucine Rich Repeat [Seminavis robusta]|eukprot:Sro1097_g240880.1 Leucine Rich Repeat (714) ;mRNA; f:24869-27117